MSPSSTDLYDLTIASHLIVEQFLVSQGYASSASQLRLDAAASGLHLPTLSPTDGADPSLDLRHLVETYRSGLRADERKRKAEQLAATHSTRALVDPLTLTLPGPATLPYKLERTHSTLHASNILSIAKLYLARRAFDTRAARYVNSVHECLVTTAADKRIVFSNAQTGEVEEMLEGGHQAAVLCVAQDPMDARCLVSCGMDGKVVVWDLLTRRPIQTLTEHAKFVVKVAVSETGEYMASIGYDKKVVVYRRITQTSFAATRGDVEEEEEEAEVEELQGPRYEKAFEMETQTNPEAILFVRAGLAPDASEQAIESAAATTAATTTSSSDSNGSELVIHEAKDKRTWLCFTVRNDSFIHYIALPTSADASSSSSPIDDLSSSLSRTSIDAKTAEAVADWTLHSFNTNPNPHDLHVSYSLLSLSLHPSGLYMCVQTGDHTSPALASTSSAATATGSLSRLLLLRPLSSRRAATIWTGVATSSYAVPRHAWLPSGRGCWLNAEDGVLRLVDLRGRTRASVLAHGVTAREHAEGQHAEGAAAVSWSRGGNTIVKDVVVLDEGRVASCGFDRTVRVVALADAVGAV
ncbi:hypothetical protein EX895_000223 [Sporisorium graminicola]|uniref:Uncharacterized protein n=1 Tax=Sporisorium graminicola TaxID=280036 RepID=A0A4U7KZA2_9BASI|nr:hypothetical protein EX895_000223 [Sporisorium graminicola]TKY90225.1 hypothetical protein EX895_000223 [Sporisorium graminicola]